jgi:L-fuconolactonase
MSEAARRPNCVVKYSGLDPLDDGTVDAWRPYVDHVFEQFGAERVLWASNWPATRLGADGSYQQIVDDSRRLLPSLAPSALDAVFGDNAERVYGC